MTSIDYFVCAPQRTRESGQACACGHAIRHAPEGGVGAARMHDERARAEPDATKRGGHQIAGTTQRTGALRIAYIQKTAQYRARERQ